MALLDYPIWILLTLVLFGWAVAATYFYSSCKQGAENFTINLSERSRRGR